LHPLTVRRWVKEGKIAAVQIRREARIPITEVERLLGEQRAGLLVLYGRVSGHDQQPDLQRQVEQLLAHDGGSRDRAARSRSTSIRTRNRA